MQTATNKSLYEIGTDFLELARLLEDLEGDVTPEIEEKLMTTLKEGEGKLINYYRFIKNLKFEADVIKARRDVLKAEVERLDGIIKTKLNKFDRNALLMEQFMKLTGIDKIKEAEVDVILRKTTDVDYSGVSEEHFVGFYTQPEPKFDSVSFKKWAKENEENALVIGVKFVEKKSILIR
ncbi:MAG: hypothetical protein E6Q68_05980 [Polynucleobacter sp.]|nr:MAG: hypothetical protein E6Q68_05980 [Polynucleobacter sp.]